MMLSFCGWIHVPLFLYWYTAIWISVPLILYVTTISFRIADGPCKVWNHKFSRVSYLCDLVESEFLMLRCYQAPCSMWLTFKCVFLYSVLYSSHNFTCWLKYAKFVNLSTFHVLLCD
jgi:hypothetical protein